MNPEPDPAAAGPVPGQALPAADVAAATPSDNDKPGTTALPDEALPAPPAETQSDEAPVAAQAAPAMPDHAPAAHSAKAVELSPAACGARLAALFPALFVGPDGHGTWKAIKLRIHADIQARAPGEFSKRTLGIFFSRYTTTTAYLKALASAPHRVDLDGLPAGDIAAEHRQAATEELARRQALAAERRAGQRPPPQREPQAAESAAAPAAGRDAPPDRPRSEIRPQARRDQRPDARPPPWPRDGAPQTGRAARPARPARPSDPSPRADRGQRAEHAPPPREAPVPTALPVDPVQRDRALLCRSFEASPLSKANFCALKGITEAALDAALSQTQTARGERAAAPIAATGRGGRGR